MVKVISARCFFISRQLHPEFKSKALEPHPIFRDFITAG